MGGYKGRKFLNFRPTTTISPHVKLQATHPFFPPCFAFNNENEKGGFSPLKTFSL